MLNSNQSPRLIKHIIRSYARLSDSTRVRSILKDNLPGIFKDKTFITNLDENSKRWVQNIYKNLSIPYDFKFTDEKTNKAPTTTKKDFVESNKTENQDNA